MLVTTAGKYPILTRVPDMPDAEDICARVERMKKLCDELDAAQKDNRKYHTLIERIRAEADAFRQRLGTHDPRP
jgi:hypothetical protein